MDRKQKKLSYREKMRKKWKSEPSTVVVYYILRLIVLAVLAAAAGCEPAGYLCLFLYRLRKPGPGGSGAGGAAEPALCQHPGHFRPHQSDHQQCAGGGAALRLYG